MAFYMIFHDFLFRILLNHLLDQQLFFKFLAVTFSVHFLFTKVQEKWRNFLKMDQWGHSLITLHFWGNEGLICMGKIEVRGIEKCVFL